MAEQILEQLFDSPLRVKLLKLFLRHPGQRFTMKEISRRVKSDATSCRRHIDRLKGIKLIERRLRGNVRTFSVNTEFDFYKELRILVLKSSPASKKRMLEKIKKLGRVKLILLSGVFVNLENARVDLMIVADRMNKTRLDNYLKDLGAEVGKDIDYVLLSSSDFKYRHNMFDRFLRDILEKHNEKILNKLKI